MASRPGPIKPHFGTHATFHHIASLITCQATCPHFIQAHTHSRTGSIFISTHTIFLALCKPLKNNNNSRTNNYPYLHGGKTLGEPPRNTRNRNNEPGGNNPPQLVTPPRQKVSFLGPGAFPWHLPFFPRPTGKPRLGGQEPQFFRHALLFYPGIPGQVYTPGRTLGTGFFLPRGVYIF